MNKDCSEIDVRLLLVIHKNAFLFFFLSDEIYTYTHKHTYTYTCIYMLLRSLQYVKYFTLTFKKRLLFIVAQKFYLIMDPLQLKKNCM